MGEVHPPFPTPAQSTFSELLLILETKDRALKLFILPTLPVPSPEPLFSPLLNGTIMGTSSLVCETNVLVGKRHETCEAVGAAPAQSELSGGITVSFRQLVGAQQSQRGSSVPLQPCQWL